MPAAGCILEIDFNLLKMPTTAMEFVPIGNLGNSSDAADSNGLSFGKVDYYYNISKYETTYGQYAEFLNAVAKSDPHGLFNPGMQQDLLLNGITRTGVDGNYSYSVAPSTGSPLTQNTEGSENKPVTYVNYLDAIRFANWMHNGKGTGSTESGAYLITTAAIVGASRWNNIITYKATGDLSISVGDQALASVLTGSGFDTRSTIRSVTKKDGFTYFTVQNRNSNGIATGSGTVTVIPATHASGARYWIPTENEWYKAAYFKPTSSTSTTGVYYDWATQSDTTPGNILINPSDPNKANTRTNTGFTKSPLSSLALGLLPDPLIGPNMLTPVGTFSGSASHYGTFDQDGNVTEWNESIYDLTAAFGDYNGSVNGTRSKRGASFYNPASGSSKRDDGLMVFDAGYAQGFRLASASTLTPNSNPTPVTPVVPTASSTSSNVGAYARSAFDADENQIYSGVLTSRNEIWPTVSTAYGTIQLTLNKAKTEAFYLLNIIGLDFGKFFDGIPRTTDPGDDVAGMHFHVAPNYTVGDAHIGLINPNQDKDLIISYDQTKTMWTLTGKWTDSDQSIVSLTNSLEDLYAGELYTNIHTERVGLGEIRAQFSRSGSTTSNAALSGSAHSHGESSAHSDSDICQDTHGYGVDCAEHVDANEIYQSSSLYQGNGTDFMIDLSSVSLISTTVQASRSASYNTDLFFYRVADAQGSVVDQLTGTFIKPGESGYAAAVQASKVSNVTLSRQDNQSASESFTLQSDGFMLGLVATVANTGNTFYSFTAANADGYNHFKYLSANKVGFEDVFGGGDRDHNDLIIDLSFAA
jgi:formylglycine-generating enzyme required for sulfatase activity